MQVREVGVREVAEEREQRVTQNVQDWCHAMASCRPGNAPFLNKTTNELHLALGRSAVMLLMTAMLVWTT